MATQAMSFCACDSFRRTTSKRTDMETILEPDAYGTCHGMFVELLLLMPDLRDEHSSGRPVNAAVESLNKRSVSEAKGASSRRRRREGMQRT